MIAVLLFAAALVAFLLSAVCGGGAGLILMPLLALLLPGAQVFAFFIPQGGGPEDAVLIEQDLQADAAGSVTVSYVAATTATAPGGYSIVVGDGLDVIEAPFTVVAAVDPAAPTPPGGNAPAAAPPVPVLAATGIDVGAVLPPAVALLLLGVALGVASRRSQRD